MAIQSSFYNTDGITRTFPSTKHIASSLNVAVWYLRVLDSVWVQANISDWVLVNNSVVFDTAPSILLYSQVEIRVADDTDELVTSPSDISIVASNIADINIVATDIDDVSTVATNIVAVQNTSASIANVNTTATNIANVNTTATNILDVNTTATNIANINIVANDLNEPLSEIDTVAVNIADVNTVGSGIANVNIVATDIANVNSVATTVVPNIAEILLADDNATIATTKAGEASTSATNALASENKAEKWADELEDVEVEVGKYSAKHWAAKAEASVTDISSNVTYDNTVSGLTATNVKTALDELTSEKLNKDLSDATEITTLSDTDLLYVSSGGVSKKIQHSNIVKELSDLSHFKNHIIDGRFDFWYEGTTQTTSGYGSDTMWKNTNSGSTKTHSQQVFTVGGTFPDGKLYPQYFSRTVVTSVAGAANYVLKTQKMEDVTKLAGKMATLSFYAKADANKNIAIEMSQAFGTGGTPSATVSGIGAQKIALTTSWAKYTATIAIPSISGKTLGTDGVSTSYTSFGFWFDAGSDYNARTDTLGQQSGTFDIAMVQLEDGSVATDFQDISYGVEENRVYRYYIPKVRCGGTMYVSSSPVTLRWSTQNPVTMRGTPSTTVTTVTASSIGTISVSTVGTHFTEIQGTTTAAGSITLRTDVELDARL